MSEYISSLLHLPLLSILTCMGIPLCKSPGFSFIGFGRICLWYGTVEKITWVGVWLEQMVDLPLTLDQIYCRKV